MAKKVLRYTEEEFVTLLENIVKKVKSEQKRLDESRNTPRSVRESNRPRPVNNRPTSNDRFRKLK
jgi:hypothetical protein